MGGAICYIAFVYINEDICDAGEMGHVQFEKRKVMTESGGE